MASFLRYSFPDADALHLQELGLDLVQAVQDSGLEALQVLEAALDDPARWFPFSIACDSRKGNSRYFFCLGSSAGFT